MKKLKLLIACAFMSSQMCAQVLPQDSLALVDLYNNTGGTSWVNNNNWLVPGQNVSTWYGVSVSGNRVRAISMPSNELSGTIPTSIGDLDNLDYLNLQDNQLTGLIPVSMTTLNLLTHVYLDQNQLSGDLPWQIGDMSQLIDFFANDNQLTGSFSVGTNNLSHLFNLNNLERLGLNGNDLSGTIPAGFSSMTSLKSLFLQSNNFSGNLVNDLPNSIEEAWFSENDFSGTIPVTYLTLPSLKYLGINGNDLSGAIPNLGAVATFEWLFAGQNDFTDMDALTVGPNLLYVSVEDNLLTFADLESNVGIPTFIYAPQAKINDEINTTVTLGSSYTMEVVTDGTSNTYQWLHEGNPILGATNSTYTLTGISASDGGAYTCHVENTTATALTLIRNDVNLITTADSTVFFDGTNDRITIPHHAAYQMGSGDFTIEAQIKADPTQKAYPRIVSHRSNAQDGFILFLWTNGKLAVQMNGSNKISTSANLRDGLCHHVAITRSGTSCTFYVDGETAGSFVLNNDIDTDIPANLYIGYAPPVNAPYEGEIDDVRLWNVSRTQSEIQATMDGSLSGTETGLIGLWHFDNDNSGQVAHDNSLTANHGTYGSLGTPDGADPILTEADCSVISPMPILESAGIQAMNSENLSLAIYPNPSQTGIFQLMTNGFEDNKTIIVTDLSGKVVLEILSTANQNEINLSAFEKGIYFMRVADSSNQLVDKMIVE